MLSTNLSCAATITTRRATRFLGVVARVPPQRAQWARYLLDTLPGTVMEVDGMVCWMMMKSEYQTGGELHFRP